MATTRLLLLGSFTLSLSVLCHAQHPKDTPVCAGKLQSSMACVIPQVYGATGLHLPNPTQEAHFTASSEAFGNSLASVGVSLGSELTLAGDLATSSSGKLPNAFFYSSGFDIGVTKRLTVAADLLGTRLSSSIRFRETAFVDVNGNPQPGIPQIVPYRDAVNMDDVSLGAKVGLTRNLLVTANVLLKANEDGLRDNVVPFVGLSYTF